MADTIKCTNCGGNLKFDPETQKLSCAFCGAVFDPSLFEDAVKELETQAPAGVEAQAPQAAVPYYFHYTSKIIPFIVLTTIHYLSIKYPK